MRILKKLDWSFILPFIGLTGLGLVAIYGTAFPSSELSFFYKQVFFFGLSLCLMLGVALFFDYRWLKTNSLMVLGLYFVLIFLLIGLFFFPSIRDIHGWYHLGSLTLDPVPFAQLGLIIVLAKYFSMRHPQLRQLPVLFLSSVYAVVPTILVFLQPDFGSAVIFVLIWLGMVIVSGLKWRHILILFLSFMVIGSLVWFFGLHAYQRERVLNFAYSSSSTEKTAWHLRQSEIAIGSGGWLGKGPGRNSQARYGFLPEARTDFVFSVIAEEFGFLGTIALFSFLITLAWKLVRYSSNASDNFAYLLTLGYLVWITSQSFISIGMSLGFLPVVGVPLPLVSYGGSSLLAFYLGGGLIMSTRFQSA